MRALAPYIIGLVVIVLLAVGVYQVKRWWNYTWGYERQVTETVCEMVKPEYLIDPSKCK